MSAKDTGGSAVAPIKEAFSRLVDLLVEGGAPMPITQHDGVYEVEIDDRWKAAFNGHPTEQKWKHATIPAFHAAIEFNGWPAGLINPYAGVIAAGECANENTFIDAVNAAIALLAARKEPQ